MIDQYFQTQYSPLPTHAPTRWTTLLKVINRMMSQWAQLKQLFSSPNKPRILREFFNSPNSESICYFLQNVLKIFEDPILALQVLI